MKFVLALLLALQISPVKTSAPSNASHEQLQGAHGVRNEQYGLFLRPRDASNRDGEPIVLYPYQPWKCMAWRFESAAGGTRLVNFFTGKSFATQPSSANKALIQMPSSPEHQQRESLHFIALEHNSYEIMNEAGDALTAIDSDGHGDIRVIVSPWKNAASQRWKLVDIPDHFTM
jgi:hypothetical protein